MNLEVNNILANISEFTKNFLKEIEKVMEKENFKDDFNIEGEIYIVDEIGDDEKYVFLTREKDGKEEQVFEISDELYEELLNDTSEILKVKYENGEYKKLDKE